MKKNLDVIAVFLMAATFGCPGSKPPCFPASSLIYDARIVAVRTDPPEAIVDPTGVDSLAPTSIAMLLLNAAEDATGEYGHAFQVVSYATTISICRPPPIADVNAQPGCPTGSLVIGQLAQVPSLQTPFVYTPPLSMIQEAIAQDPLHGLAGVTLTLQLSVAAPNGTLTATKALRYRVKGTGATLNHGLEITGMELSVNGVHTTASGGKATDLVAAQSSGLRPLIGPGAGGTEAVETYMDYDNSGRLVQFVEHVTYAFYGGNALFFGTPHNGPEAIYTGAAGDVADEPPAGSDDPPDGLVTVEPVDGGTQSGFFWVVARDGRGAVSWAPIDYSVIDLRSCETHCPTIFFGCN